VVRQGRRLSSAAVDTCPLEFFRVFLPDHAAQGLSIPPEFTHQLKKGLPQKATFANHSGKTWHVNVDKDGHNVIFKEGWEAFMRDSGLEVGDFLVFTYNGGSKFGVKVFGPDGCLRDRAITSKFSYNWCSSNHQEEDVKTGITILPGNFCPHANQSAHEDHKGSTSMEMPRRGNDSIDGNFPGKSQSIKSETYPSETEVKSALEKAERCVSKSKYPSFTVVMTPTYITKRMINIPVSVIIEHFGRRKKPQIELQMVGRIWSVQMHVHGKYSCKIGRGWHEFVVDNHLKLGDVCAFELVKEIKPFFKISVFRCARK